MYQIIMIIHVLAAISIVALVLVQQGKGATMGAAFGSGASSTVFGSRGSGSFLFRITLSFIAVFFITSITLNYMVAHAYKQEKVIQLPAVPSSKTAPATMPLESTLPEQIPGNAKQTVTVAPVTTPEKKAPVSEKKEKHASKHAKQTN